MNRTTSLLVFMMCGCGLLEPGAPSNTHASSAETVSAIWSQADIKIVARHATIETFVRRAPGQLGHHPNYLPVAFVLRDASGAEVERVDVPLSQPSVTPRRGPRRDDEKVTANFQGSDIRVLFDLPRAGDYRVEVEELGVVKFRKAVTAGLVPCIGKSATLEAHGVDAASLKDDLTLSRWDDELQDPAYRVEWWKDGALVTTDEGREDHLTNFVETWERLDSPMNNDMHMAVKTCLWSYRKETYHRPAQVSQAGAWEVRVYREGQAPLAFQFHMQAGVADFAEAPVVPESDAWMSRIPQLQHKHIVSSGDRNPIPMTAGELRALYRSPDLLKQRLDFNGHFWPIHGHTSGLTDTEKATLGPQAQADLYKARLGNAIDAGAADSRSRRAVAVGRVPALRAAIQQQSGPWTDLEKPIHR